MRRSQVLNGFAGTEKLFSSVLPATPKKTAKAAVAAISWGSRPST